MRKILPPGKIDVDNGEGGYILPDILIAVLIMGISFISVFTGLITASRGAVRNLEMVKTEISDRNTHSEGIYEITVK